MSEQSEEIYIRQRACSACKGTITIQRIMNGWIVTCKCGLWYRKDFEVLDDKLWKRVSAGLV